MMRSFSDIVVRAGLKPGPSVRMRGETRTQNLMERPCVATVNREPRSVNRVNAYPTACVAAGSYARYGVSQRSASSTEIPFRRA